MLSSEEFNDSRQIEPPPSGLVFLLVSSLLQGCGSISGSALEVLQPRSVEAASLDGPRFKKTTQANRKTNRQVNGRERKLKKVIRGEASWYGPGFHGKKTASGEIFDQRKLTAAHKTLPLGTKAKVTNLQNGNTVEVEINDRGPYVGERVIDLSHAAADVLGFVESGITLVRIELLPEGSGLEEAG
jgi:rare lipoprotein A